MLFFSSYQNRIDKKGRISVPASFRASLSRGDTSGMSGGVIVYQSLRNNCIEACGMTRFEKMNAQIEAMDPFSPEREAFADTLFGQSVQLTIDGDGRVMMPPAMLKAAGIKEDALFVGKGEVFEIWEPKAYQQHSANARATVKQKFHQLLPQGKKS